MPGWLNFWLLLVSFTYGSDGVDDVHLAGAHVPSDGLRPAMAFDRYENPLLHISSSAKLIR